MKVICIIPARLKSTRLPRKPLAMIAGKPMVQRTYEAAITCPDIDKVVVATDNQAIIDVLKAAGGEAVMSPEALETGSDRVAFVAEQFPDYDVVINLQGDEPFMKGEMLSTLIKPFKQDDSVNMATLGSPLHFESQHQDPNIVKVLYDFHGDAIYFSRSPLPYFRQSAKNVAENINVLHHMGVYAYRKDFLRQYTRLPQTPMEIAEALEQLRAIEHGFKIRVCKVPHRTLEINTPEELERAQNWVAD
jgi:3-deoxy-manno-octulosonate cytidylyltransferase (CMP-KDO synthetase)